MNNSAQTLIKDWRESLPEVRGRLRFDVPLSSRCWFGVGGAAQCLYTPEDIHDLRHFLVHIPQDVPVTVIGVGSNLLVRDGGIEGVVIRLGRDFAAICHENTTITAGAAALDVNIARYAAEAGIAKLEFLVGIPGTIGGAVRMNAGAYGSDIAAIVTDIEAVDRQGRIHRISGKDAGFSYRHSSLPEDWIVTSVTLKGRRDDALDISDRMEQIMADREASQPVRSKTGGSTFKNPTGHKAWQLIDAAGCRGLARGDAQISDMHCNFMINHGNASADDLESLGEEVRKRVFDASGIMLEWEIKRIGKRETIANS